jgi:hypothetical protein
VLEEQTLGRKHLLRVSGVRTITYWSGMLVADYILFLLTATPIAVVACFVGLRVYQDQLLTFLVSLALSGLPIIALSYMLSKGKTALWNIFIQFWLGVGIPLAVLAILGESGFASFVTLVFYLIAPMFTFYLTSYTLVVQYLNPFLYAKQKDMLATPTMFGSEATLGFSVGVSLLQFVVYFGLNVLLDGREARKYRVNDDNKEKIIQPTMELNPEVKDHENELRQGSW